ncbi:MAG: TerB family tellurite resistance protein [Sphingomonadaceae bacterium]
MSEPLDPSARFAGVDRVVADPLRFKLRLGIGEDAYATLRLRKTLQELWDVGGMAATGATAAASPLVATTFFSSTATGGLLSLLGLGTAAATPVGWVAAAAVASGGAYYGVTRLARSWTGACVDTIPKFLNTPIDLLAASLLDLVGALALRVAAIDGQIAETERAAIERHFVADWGLDPGYVSAALDLITRSVEQGRVKDLARALASFQAENPDCNPAAMQAELMQFLRDVVAADGMIDEHEELALDAIERVLREETEFSFTRAGRQLAGWTRDAAGSVAGLAGRLPKLGRDPGRE